jgi:fused signal recognition particle receptor
LDDQFKDSPKAGFFRRLFGPGPKPAEPAPAPHLKKPAAAPAPPVPVFTASEPVTRASLAETAEREFQALQRLFPRAAPVEAEPAPELFAPAETAPAAPVQTDESAPPRRVLRRMFARETAAPADTPSAEPEAPPRSWLARLTFGLSRSSSVIGRGIVDIFTKRKLDETALDDLEDILLQADLGLGPATRIREAIGKGRYETRIDPGEVKRLLAEEVERTLTPVARPLAIDASHKPFVILVVGVNGSGKTTTIGKLAAKFAQEGRKVTLAAGDTFRAAAIEQLKIWAGRAKAEIFAREQGGDAASLAFDALTHAKASGADVLLMDTAGRLQNRAELMNELEKIIRVIKKVDPTAPHATLLVLDATVGQNALSQVEIFGRTAGVTGLVMTKLDGTARGGILVAIADKHKLPVHFIGVGEQMEDLEPFEAKDFAKAIAGIE